MELDFTQYYVPFPKQIEFHMAKEPFLLYGGAMEGGKTRALCGDIVQYSIDHPKNKVAVIRRHLTSLKLTTMATFWLVCPKELYDPLYAMPNYVEAKKVGYNSQDKTLTLINGSQILFLGIDRAKDPEYNLLRSLELSDAYVDEAGEQTDIKFFTILATRVGRHTCADGYKSTGRIKMASNPAQGWVRDCFITRIAPKGLDEFNLKDFRFIQSSVYDNPHVSQDRINRLSSIMDENTRKSLLFGDWTVADLPDQLIKFQWIIDATRKVPDSEYKFDVDLYQRFLATDVARMGNDQTVMTLKFGQDIAEQMVFDKNRTTTIASNIKLVAKDKQIPDYNTIVDDAGVGGGVTDILHEEGFAIFPFNSSNSPLEMTGNEKFMNLRSQAWWITRNLFESGSITIPNDPELIKDLSSPKYRVIGKHIVVEPKDETRKKIGRSPDRGDSVVMVNLISECKDYLTMPVDLSDFNSEISEAR